MQENARNYYHQRAGKEKANEYYKGKKKRIQEQHVINTENCLVKEMKQKGK